jgi:hypothetical protein
MRSAIFELSLASCAQYIPMTCEYLSSPSSPALNSGSTENFEVMPVQSCYGLGVWLTGLCTKPMGWRDISLRSTATNDNTNAGWMANIQKYQGFVNLVVAENAKVNRRKTTNKTPRLKKGSRD